MSVSKSRPLRRFVYQVFGATSFIYAGEGLAADPTALGWVGVCALTLLGYFCFDASHKAAR